jgi:hypothetical protein
MCSENRSSTFPVKSAKSFIWSRNRVSSSVTGSTFVPAGTFTEANSSSASGYSVNRLEKRLAL